MSERAGTIREKIAQQGEGEPIAEGSPVKRRIGGQRGGSVIHKVEFMPNPTQKRFIESQAKADLFASRVGEGKSAALAWAIFWHTKANPGANWAMIRDTWENLQRTTQREFFKWFPPGIFGQYHAAKKEFVWNAARLGIEGSITFLGLDDPGDASKLQSLELAGIAMDEPAPAAESGGIDELIFDIGLSRLRQPGMNWYAFKLAENNPDETHWTYKRFVEEETKSPGFVCWQTKTSENDRNLPSGYYENLAASWAHRPDLKRRFLEGKFGFQQMGKSVTPEWNDDIHLSPGLEPVKNYQLDLLWDGGLNPTCIITQVSPSGVWHILEAYVGDGIGAYELISDIVRPRLTTRFRGFQLRHIGDPALDNREQSRAYAHGQRNSAAQMIRRELGGTFIKGPIDIDSRVEPLRARLRQVQPNGAGYVQVDVRYAKEVWHALRGGWHRHIPRTGITGEIVKNIHSHPGDAVSYGAGVLFPLGRVQQKKMAVSGQKAGGYFNGGQSGLGFERPGLKIPKEMRTVR